jgi:RNA polymerase sigma factor (TIGR02999 family)
MSDPTQILKAASVGDRTGVASLMGLVYDDMRKLAHKYLSGPTPHHTLAPTAVVHEAFIKLVDQDRVDWRGKSHFFAVGAKAMRQILVDYARKNATLKRGGDRQRIPIGPDVAVSASQDEDVLALDEALEELAKINS